MEKIKLFTHSDKAFLQLYLPKGLNQWVLSQAKLAKISRQEFILQILSQLKEKGLIEIEK